MPTGWLRADAALLPASRCRCAWRRTQSRDRTTLRARGCGVRQESIPRGLTILKGAVPGRARGLGHMAPTYFCRFPGSRSDGHRGSALLSRSCLTQPKRQSPKALPPCRSAGAARCHAGGGARGGGRDDCRAAVSGCGCARHDRLRLHAAEERNQPAAADAQARRAPARSSRCRWSSGRGKPLIMRAYAFGDRSGAGQWGIREPMPGARRWSAGHPAWCRCRLRPRGHRIGYGAGYYDMTINALRARKPVTAIGIAFAAQEIPRVPATRARRAARSRANGARGDRLRGS